MKLRILVVGLMLGLIPGLIAFGADTGADLYQKAMTQERAAGNLDEAIRLYQRVLKEFGADRALAAKALLAEARCYEKLGQDQATKLYEQVTHDYREQREPVATANARLAALRQGAKPGTPGSATMTQRRIDLTNTSAFAIYQTDGQRKIAWNKPTGELSMSDLSGANRRVIYKLKEDRQVNSFMASRDFSLLLLQLKKPDNSETFAFLKTDGTGFRELPGDWRDAWGCNPEIAWDNRSVLLCPPASSGPPQLVRVTVADGQSHGIRDALGSQFRLSPDGRFLAYAVGGGVYVAPTDGGPAQLIAPKGYVCDWTRDGRYLIASTLDESADALYLIPIRDGQRAGTPVFVRYGAFRPYNAFFEAGRTLASGAFLYQATPPGGQYAAWLGKLEAGAGSVRWEKLALFGNNANMHDPVWSPDSGSFAYIGHDDAAGQLQGGSLRLHTIVGDDRELYRGTVGGGCMWPAGTSLLCSLSNRQWLSVSTETGHSEVLSTAPFQVADSGRDHWSNGGLFAVKATGAADWKQPLTHTDIRQETISPDGKIRIFHGRDAAGKQGLFRVAATGGQPERLGDFPGGNMRGGMWISPDAQKIVVDILNPLELWMVENFEPKP